MRICFLNPFGTPEFDSMIADLLRPSLSEGVELEVRHLNGELQYMYYFAAKHILEMEVMREVVRAERDGFDAVVIGCCYDPGLTQCRELVDIPVIGPLEASVANMRPFGHRYAVVTDHAKAATEIEDRVRLYGQEANCRTVTSVDWLIHDMLKDPAAVAEDAYRICQQIMKETRAETVLIGCTIVAACYELTARTDPRLSELSVVDPNILAIKQAQMFAELRATGQYRMSRTAYYKKLDGHSPDEAAKLYEILER